MNSNLQALGHEIWAWRAATQPLSGDDIPRLERPDGWVPDWSPPAVAARRQELARFDEDHARLAAESRSWPVADQVDYRLLGSALARVHWELDVLRGWQRNPRFYIHQTLGAVFEALLEVRPTSRFSAQVAVGRTSDLRLPRGAASGTFRQFNRFSAAPLEPPPFETDRVRNLVVRLESIPSTLDAARENLDGHAVQPFARLAIGSLDNIGARLHDVSRGLADLLAPESAAGVAAAINRARGALDGFAEWLRAGLETMSTRTAIGREAYVDFLRSVALVALSPEQIVAGAQQELERAITFEALAVQRNRDQPGWSLPGSVEEQIAREARGEDMLRAFSEEHDLLTFPDWLRRYRYLPRPPYLTALRGLGVFDDLTSPTRLDQDGIHYVPPPAEDLPYFYLAMARDPRTLIAHEGVHYYQLARSWANPDPLRRSYYDSGPNEGIGFYTEEMYLQAGLFDDSPRTSEIIYNFMRLRAVRVAVDVGLALGDLTIDTAAEELARRVPMDVETAREEAASFASDPGQAITYQVGKLQILGFLADARRVQGERFTLRAFHDSLFENGNVPIALQRWEALGLDDGVPVP